MKVYVYMEYNDWTAYGNEIVRVFADKNDAISYFKHRIEKAFECSFDEVKKMAEKIDEDVLSDGFFSHYDGDKTSFWSVTEKKIIEKGEEYDEEQ